MKAVLKSVIFILLVSTFMTFLSGVCLGVGSASGIVGQYKFDGDFKDSSSNGNDGTNVGTVAFADDGLIGKCAVFSGGFIKVPESASLNLGKKFTISSWVKLTPDESNSNNSNTLIAKESNNKELLLDPMAYRIKLQGMHDASLTLSQLAGGYSPSVGSSGVGTYNFQEKWTLVTLVDDGDTLYLYIDGKLDSTNKAGSDGVFFEDKANGVIYIGGLVDGDKFMGRMDDLRIYNKALNGDEVVGIYNEVYGAYTNKIVLKIGENTMMVDGKQIPIDPNSTYTVPLIKDGRTLVPIRAIIENMGGTVGWDNNERRVDITLKGSIIKLWLDNTSADVNGKKISLDVPAQSINNRTMVPVRFVAENLGAKVEWNKETQEATIRFSK